MRSQLFRTFELAQLAPDQTSRQPMLNIVVVGDGPTRVESAGELAEARTHILPRDHPDTDYRKVCIYLVEGGKRLLDPTSAESAARTTKYLAALSLLIRTSGHMQGYDGEMAVLSTGRTTNSASS